MLLTQLVHVMSSVLWAAIAQPVWWLTMGWMVQGLNHGGGREFLHPSRPALGHTQPPIQLVPGLTPW